ncbi:MAG: hypothetical protein Q7I94_04515 [Candidatus Contubernalis sp.]|nr:hypothetical protein [Candidatus Contubernalis sp.]
MLDIIDILQTKGPMTGKELLKEAGSDEFSLWVACNRSDKIITHIIGKRYLRLDVQVAEYARLSPSIMREFYGYTVIGTTKHAKEILLKAELLQKEILDISKKKSDLAKKVMTRLVDSHQEFALIKKCACFMIVGDVVYGMSHGEPRPESSTGELVKGSDLDIIVVVENMPEKIISSLDEAIHLEKHQLLRNPSSREEIDYIVKDMVKVQEQLKFKDFKSMVASKILHEADFLYGSNSIFTNIKNMLKEADIPHQLHSLEKKARINREKAQAYLLQSGNTLSKEEFAQLFYTSEEVEEIF